MQAPSLRLLAVLSLATRVALAYEGAGMTREEDAPPPPKVPQLTKAPAVAAPVDAVYPPELLEKRVGGDVTLVIDIDATGHVPKAEVSKSSGSAQLDASARAALLQFEFTPAELDGTPAPVRLEYVYHFVPPEPPPPPRADEPPAPAPVNLEGVVLERGTRDPLSGANVYLPESNLVAQTDAEGSFQLRGAPVGRLKVEITATKHRRYETTVEVKAGETTQLTAYVWKEIENGFEATVRGERDKKEVARRTLQKEELTSVPGTFGDPVRVLQNLPGMARAPFVSGALLVRGSQPQDTSVLIDGVPIPLLYHFAGGPSVVNPSFIDRIDFYPGAYGAKYGRAIAGVVDIGTKPPEPKAVHGNFDVDFLKAGFYVEGPVSKSANYGSWALAARRSYFDAFLPTILEAARKPGQASIVAAPRYWDYQSRYDLTLGANKLELVVFGSDDLLTVAQSGTADTQGFSINQHQGFHRARLKWSRKLGDGLSFYVAPTAGTTTVDVDFNDLVKLHIFSYDINTRAALVKEFSRSLVVEGGLELNANLYRLGFKLPMAANYFTFPGESPPLGTSERTYAINLPSQAAYVEAVWRVAGGLKVVPGLRFELYNIPAGSTPSVEPRLATRYELDESTALKLAWGLYRQGPNPMNLDGEFGNPDLGLSKSSQWDVGFERKLLQKLTLDLQLFYNWRYELEARSSQIIDRDGKKVAENFANSGYGKAYGLELLVKQDLTERAYGWIAYTLSRSLQKDVRTDQYLPVGSDQTHILTVVGSYKWDGGWETGARFRLTTGRPTTNLVGANYDTDTGGYGCLRSAPGTARGPTFQQLDVRVERLFTYDLWRLSAFLDIQNLFNAENPEFVLTDYRCRATAPLRGLPFLPTLGVTGSY